LRCVLSGDVPHKFGFGKLLRQLSKAKKRDVADVKRAWPFSVETSLKLAYARTLADTRFARAGEYQLQFVQFQLPKAEISVLGIPTSTGILSQTQSILRFCHPRAH